MLFLNMYYFCQFRDVHIIKTYKNYARFEELNSNIEYKCIVYSVNEHGASKDYSTVYVPKESDSKFCLLLPIYFVVKKLKYCIIY